jgi:hypothetical protein
MTLKWMAGRLKMEARTHVANRLYHLKKLVSMLRARLCIADGKQTGKTSQYDNIKTCSRRFFEAVRNFAVVVAVIHW